MTRDPETTQKAIDKIEELIALELKQIELQRELRRALMIGKIAPGVFEKGFKARVRVEGGMTYTSLGDCPSSKSQFIVGQVDGPYEVSVPLFEVPLELWPEHMVKALRLYRRTTYAKLTGADKEKADA